MNGNKGLLNKKLLSKVAFIIFVPFTEYLLTSTMCALKHLLKSWRQSEEANVVIVLIGFTVQQRAVINQVVTEIILR